MAARAIEQSFNQMDDRKLVTCAWNSNHEVSHSRYQAHQLKCPDRPKFVEKCQYNNAHEFRTKKEKDDHELNCEGMLRRLREQQELAELKQRGKFIGAPIIVKQIAAGESSDPWADEGEQAGVQNFKASGLGLSPQEIEEFIEKYDGNEPVCEYMLVAMSWSQKQRINEKQKIRTNERSAEAMKRGQGNTVTPAVVSDHSVRPPRNTVIASVMNERTRNSSFECAKQEMGSGDSESNQQLRDKNNPWSTNRNPVAPSVSAWPSLDKSVEDNFKGMKLTGIGRGRDHPTKSNFMSNV